MSNDPIGFAAGDANLYRYVANQPMIGADPSGLVRPPSFNPGFGVPIEDPFAPPPHRDPFDIFPWDEDGHIPWVPVPEFYEPVPYKPYDFDEDIEFNPPPPSSDDGDLPDLKIEWEQNGWIPQCEIQPKADIDWDWKDPLKPPKITNPGFEFDTGWIF